VEVLRGQGYGGEISVIGDEADLPYDRPPLSKQVLSGQWGPTGSPWARRRTSIDGGWTCGWGWPRSPRFGWPVGR
jgi:hypothetical protein